MLDMTLVGGSFDRTNPNACVCGATEAGHRRRLESTGREDEFSIVALEPESSTSQLPNVDADIIESSQRCYMRPRADQRGRCRGKIVESREQ